MTSRSISDLWTISNVILTLAVVGGLILCYFLAIPFLPAIVWSVTLGVLFAPLDARMRRFIRSVSISAAATVAVVAFIVVPRHPCSVPLFFGMRQHANERAIAKY